MKNNRLICFIVLISGIIITITGILHIAATPMVYKQLLSDPLFQGESSDHKIKGMAYFFMVMGLLYVFSGLLMTLSTKELKRNGRFGCMTSMTSAIMILIVSLAALIYAGFSNSLIYMDIFFSSITILAIGFKRNV